MFCISVTSLFGYHLYLVTRNQTTLESFRAPIFRPNLVPDKRGFHLGTMNNVQEVFGDTRFLWFFPVNSGLGDGICFPQRSTFLGKTQLVLNSESNIKEIPSVIDKELNWKQNGKKC